MVELGALVLRQRSNREALVEVPSRSTLHSVVRGFMRNGIGSLIIGASLANGVWGLLNLEESDGLALLVLAPFGVLSGTWILLGMRARIPASRQQAGSK